MKCPNQDWRVSVLGQYPGIPWSNRRTSRRCSWRGAPAARCLQPHAAETGHINRSCTDMSAHDPLLPAVFFEVTVYIFL